MKKLVLAAPCYGPRDPYLEKALRVALMSAANQPKDSSLLPVSFVGDVSTIRQGWVGGRNQTVVDTLEQVDAGQEIDGIVWVDDDVFIPPTTFKRLLGYDKDFVTAVIYQKFGEYNPLVAEWGKTGFNYWRTYPDNVLAKADGCGFGCVYTSVPMLRAIAKLPETAPKGKAYFKKDGWFDQFPGDWFGNENTTVAMSEDFSFCVRAKAAGFQLYADTGLELPHMIGPQFSTRENHERYWKQRRVDAKGAVDRVRELEGLTCADAVGF